MQIKKIIFVLVIILIFVGAGLISLYIYKNKHPSPQDCSKIDSQISKLLDTANYCTSDSDCVLTSGMFWRCSDPVVNKKVDLGSIKSIMATEQTICPQIELPCPLIPLPGQVIKCVGNKCVWK